MLLIFVHVHNVCRYPSAKFYYLISFREIMVVIMKNDTISSTHCVHKSRSFQASAFAKINGGLAPTDDNGKRSSNQKALLLS